ncbi:MAG TPA: hypothetical protein VL084_13840, partial [Thermoanaerobaculia bacterium]|nr:hypothetical protein [Thermoanaerobaculia bacterium]
MRRRGSDDEREEEREEVGGEAAREREERVAGEGGGGEVDLDGGAQGRSPLLREGDEAGEEGAEADEEKEIDSGAPDLTGASGGLSRSQGRVLRMLSSGFGAGNSGTGWPMWNPWARSTPSDPTISRISR